MASMRRAAAIAGVTRNTVARWVQQGKLKASEKRMGHLVVKLVDVAEVERLARAISTGRPPRDGRD